MAYDLSLSFNLHPDTAEIGGFWPLKGLKKNYEIVPGSPEHNVNSFYQIGWPDPFPKKGVQSKSKAF
jgi:hypothetical protein